MGRWTEEMLDELTDAVNRNTVNIDRLSEKLDRLSADFKEQQIQFKAYQQGTQWVVQLAFTLIASATLTVIITTIVKR
ncbi:MAG: hypothetical protein SFW36_19480 [Leptolyngbyaceae cyanobacterium bins.59]|nr:hypothetical protein [Leptolyngbyaceae cyanobacterium bins.59]